jgi:hypothetical protein
MSESSCSTCEKHSWVVFSTAMKEVALMLQCVKCGEFGTVDDPTQEEWKEAFHAPAQPYPWTDESRITIRSEHRPSPDYWSRMVEGQNN